MELKPGYKMTEVGVIPEDWETKTLLELAEGKKELFDDGDWIEAEHITTKGVRLIQTGNIGIGKFIEKDERKYIYEASFVSLRCKELKQGDLLICRLAEPAGRSCVLEDIGEGKVVTSVDVTIFRPPSEMADRSFLTQVFSTSEWFKSVNDRSGGTTHKRISRGALGRLKVQIPPLLEQRAIAKSLLDVDALLATLDQVIAKKRDLKQATMQRLLTGKTRLPGFTGEWRIRRLGEEATFHKGKGLPKSHITPFGSEPCIHYGELFTQYPEIIKEVFSSTDKQGAYFRSIANDVLMPTSDVTPRGLAKASCIQMDGVILGGDILVIRTDPSRVYGPFLSYVIRREEAQVLRLVTGTTVFHLYGADMKKFLFQLPSIDEQRAIACVLSDMDAELSALEARREKTRQLKQAMMQELLTGRTRLV